MRNQISNLSLSGCKRVNALLRKFLSKNNGGKFYLKLFFLFLI